MKLENGWKPECDEHVLIFILNCNLMAVKILGL